MGSLLDKALAKAEVRRGGGWAEAAVAKVSLDELAELMNAWARGAVKSAQIHAALAPEKKCANPTVPGEYLALAATRRLVAAGYGFRPLGPTHR